MLKLDLAEIPTGYAFPLIHATRAMHSASRYKRATTLLRQVVVGLPAHPKLCVAPSDSFQGQRRCGRNPTAAIQKPRKCIPAHAQAVGAFRHSPTHSLHAISDALPRVRWIYHAHGRSLSGSQPSLYPLPRHPQIERRCAGYPAPGRSIAHLGHLLVNVAVGPACPYRLASAPLRGRQEFGLFF